MWPQGRPLPSSQIPRLPRGLVRSCWEAVIVQRSSRLRVQAPQRPPPRRPLLLLGPNCWSKDFHEHGRRPISVLSFEGPSDRQRRCPWCPATVDHWPPAFALARQAKPGTQRHGSVVRGQLDRSSGCPLAATRTSGPGAGRGPQRAGELQSSMRKRRWRTCQLSRCTSMSLPCLSAPWSSHRRRTGRSGWTHCPMRQTCPTGWPISVRQRKSSESQIQ
mmetsp:Transcript_23233/g.51300  ORF Transcript_23233/g.51300 Transcript_23233/m.51300 type:complete len:218 (-) Transcript_23233:667-1320(-)